MTKKQMTKDEAKELLLSILSNLKLTMQEHQTVAQAVLVLYNQPAEAKNEAQPKKDEK